jgi:hypothetical protein
MRLVIVLLVCGACSFRTNAGAPTDAHAAGPGSDAQVLTGRQQMEVVGGAGRVTHGTMTIDVEVGHPVLVRQSTAGTITLTGAQVVKP